MHLQSILREVGDRCLTNGKAVEDLREARELVVLFNVLAAVQWCLETKLRKSPDEFLWLITPWGRSFANKVHILLLQRRRSITVFHVLCTGAL
jgi:hypothetical protein